MNVYKPEIKSIVDILTADEDTFVWQLEYDDLLEKISKEPLGINLYRHTNNSRKFYFDNHIYYINKEKKQLSKELRSNTVIREFDKVPHSNRYVVVGKPEDVLNSFLSEEYSIIERK